jgi:hypothetical protein
MMDLSALFHNKIFLGLERCWCAVSARSISTVSWSLLPNAGNALHLSMIVLTSNVYYVDDKKHFPEPDTQTRQTIGPDTNS